MRIHNVAQKIAAYLAAAPEFRAYGYTVASGVRIRNVLLNGTPLMSGNVVDLLICDGSKVLIGIACRPETAQLFNHDMCGLPYVQLPKADTALPLFPDDEGWMDYPSEACLESLLEAALLSVSRVPRAARRSGKSLASCRKRDFVQADTSTRREGRLYTLPSIPPEQAIRQRPCSIPRLYSKMTEQQLLYEDGAPTSYGSAQGLFLRYRVDPFGDVFPELLTVPDAAADMQAALSPQRDKAKRARRISLVKRVQDLPAAEGLNVPCAVKNLLNAPVDFLFPDHARELEDLQYAMYRSRSLLTGEEADGSGDVPTYWEVLQTIHSLRQGFGDDPMLDDEQSCRMRFSCEKLLLLLAECFLIPPKTDAAIPKEKPFVKSQSLKERLADVHSRPGFQLFGVSLASYYQAVSRLAGCEYPNWVYRTRIRPLFENTQKPEGAYNLRFLAAYCKICAEDNGAHDWEETFPLLLDLITIPVCIKHNL